MSDQEGKSSFDLGKLGEIANSKRVTRRGVLQGVAAAGALAALGPVASACGGSSSSSSSSASPSSAGTPKKGGHIKSGVTGGSAKDTLDGHIATTEPQITEAWQIYDSLLGWDQQGKLKMLLAEEYTPSADARSHTVKLKSGLTFHNGKPVTADDVIFSFQRILDPKTLAIGALALAGLKPDAIKKVDDLTVTFTLDKPNAIFYEPLAYYNNAIVPVGYDPKGASGAIGAGPWKVTSFTPGQQVEFDAFTDYWGEGPYADKLTMIEFADPTARLNALLGGTVDHIDSVDGSQAGVIQKTPGYKLLESQSGGWDPFTMRVDQKPFSDVRVRQAFRLIFDRPQIIEQAWAGYGRLGNDMYSPFDPGYPKDLPQRVQDLEQAKSLLKQAGYNNDLTVELVTSTAVGGNMVQAAQVFAQQAKGAGVTVKVNKVDAGVFYGNDYLKWTFAQDFWGTRNYLFQTQGGTLKTAPWNETHWGSDAEWNKIVAEAFKTVDDTKRNELVTAASTIEYERGGLVVWSFNTLLDGHSDKLTGVLPDYWGLSACRSRYNLMSFV